MPLFGNKYIIISKNVCIFLFVFLCLFHYLSQRPLWLDEGFVLDNIEKTEYSQILGPLKQAQAFPRLYLIVVKFVGSLFSYHVLALRLIPFLCMFGAYFLWLKIYNKFYDFSWEYVLTLFSFTCSYRMSYYSAELKPYSMDVLVSALFCYIFLKQKEWNVCSPRIKDYIFICSMPIFLLFSYAAFFMFWIVIYNLVLLIPRNKRLLPITVLYCIISILCLLVLYNVDIKYSLAERGLVGYWESYFVCTESISCFFESLWEGIRRFSTWWYGEAKIFIQLASFLIPFFVYSLFKYGFEALKQDNYCVFSAVSFFFVLMLELFVFGIAKKYPFTGERITLFVAPLIFLCITKAIFDLKKVKVLHILFLSSYFVLLSSAYVSSVFYYMKFYDFNIPL